MQQDLGHGTLKDEMTLKSRGTIPIYYEWYRCSLCGDNSSDKAAVLSVDANGGTQTLNPNGDDIGDGYLQHHYFRGSRSFSDQSLLLFLCVCCKIRTIGICLCLLTFAHVR